MASLYKRATPSQQRIFRIVEGAVKNAGDAHPEVSIPPKFAKSIAKRAAGTLTAGWPDVLAARASSKRNASLRPIRDRSRGPAEVTSRPPLIRLRKDIVREMSALHISEQHAVYAACQDVLRLISKALLSVSKED